LRFDFRVFFLYLAVILNISKKFVCIFAKYKFAIIIKNPHFSVGVIVSASKIDFFRRCREIS